MLARRARAVTVGGRALPAARDRHPRARPVEPGAGRRSVSPAGPSAKPSGWRSARGAPAADGGRRLRQRLLDRRAPRRTRRSARTAAARERRGRIGVAACQRIGGERRVIRAVDGGRRHERAQAEASRDSACSAQASVLAHRVLGDVVEPPVGPTQRLRRPSVSAWHSSWNTSCATRVVVVQRLVGADGDRAPSVAGRVRVGGAHDPEADPARRPRARSPRRRGSRAGSEDGASPLSYVAPPAPPVLLVGALCELHMAPFPTRCAKKLDNPLALPRERIKSLQSRPRTRAGGEALKPTSRLGTVKTEGGDNVLADWSKLSLLLWRRHRRSRAARRRPPTRRPPPPPRCPSGRSPPAPASSGTNPTPARRHLPRSDDLRREGTDPVADAGLDALAVPADRRRGRESAKRHDLIADAAARDHGQRERHEREVGARVHARRKDLRKDGGLMAIRCMLDENDHCTNGNVRGSRWKEVMDPRDQHRAGRARAGALARGRRRHAHDDRKPDGAGHSITSPRTSPASTRPTPGGRTTTTARATSTRATPATTRTGSRSSITRSRP